MKEQPPGKMTPNLVPPWSVLEAPASWRHIDFISDLHLQAIEPSTFDLWRSYMQRTHADALFILGDLFEVWVGDDIAPHASHGSAPIGFESACAQVLKAASKRLDIYFMHGNRDFLLGAAFSQSCGMALLGDPTVLKFGGERWLLSHGDALCLDDTEYMKFRAEVRTPEWQRHFLEQPLDERQAVARSLRVNSELRKRSGVTYADLDQVATCDWLRATQTATLIHGHTHKPADHKLPQGRRRVVLSDWDATALPVRAEVLRLSLNESRQPSMHRLSASQASD